MFKIYNFLFLFSNIILYSFSQNVFGLKLSEINDKPNENPFSYENILLLLKSLGSLYSGLELFDTFKDDIDVDALLGVRILSDQLNVSLELLNRYLTEKDWNQILRNAIQDLKEESDQLFETTLPFIESKDYFKEVGAILQTNLWSHIPDTSLSVDESKEYDSVLELTEIPLNENISDLCVSQMLTECRFSNFCWKTMTALGYQDYPLSHQVFYLEMAKKKCGPKLKPIKSSVRSLLTIFCSNMYFENKELEENSYPKEYFDLFMENIAFCGIIGFKEFTANKDWLREILSQQKSFGCLSADSVTPPQKRKEKILKNGCSSHKTSMALASTVVYIRDIILELISYTFGVKDMIEMNDNHKY